MQALKTAPLGKAKNVSARFGGGYMFFSDVSTECNTFAFKTGLKSEESFFSILNPTL